MLNFKIKKQFFLNSLSLVQGASEKKSSIPIISNLLIESVGNNFIKISATDLELSIITYCDAEIISNGKTTVNSKKIYNIIKEFPESTEKEKTNENGVQQSSNEDLFIKFIEDETGVVTISYRKTVFKLTTVPAADYPTIIDFESEDGFNIELKTLKTLIGKVIFSTSISEDTKRNLTGVNFTLEENNDANYLRLVATDGHRLSLAQSEISYNGNKGGVIYDLLKKGFIIPKKILTEVLKLDKDGFIKILINSNNVIFEFNNNIQAEDLNKEKINKNTKFISRLIEGKFPDYKTVLPKDDYKLCIVNAKKFYNSIKMVSLIAEEKSHSIELSFNENNLLIKTVNANIGEASDELEIDYKNEPISIKLNSRYIMDFISNITENSLILKFNTIYTPFIIEPYLDEKVKSLQVIGVFMPMRY